MQLFIIIIIIYNIHTYYDTYPSHSRDADMCTQNINTHTDIYTIICIMHMYQNNISLILYTHAHCICMSPTVGPAMKHITMNGCNVSMCVHECVCCAI